MSPFSLHHLLLNMLVSFRLYVSLSLFGVLCLSFLNRNIEKKLFSLSGKAQGTTFIIHYYAEQEMFQIADIYQILNTVDSSLSQYKSYSLISRFNQSPVGVKTDKHLKSMIRSSLYFSTLTNGDFDITVKPISSLWGFNGKQRSKPPSKRHIKSVLSLVGSNHILLKGDSLVKLNPGVMIDVDGIAQGYTVDLLADYLTGLGINSFLVELGGEIVTSGAKPDGSAWSVGVEGPVEEEQLTSIIGKNLLVSGKAVTTSGNYRKFIKIRDEYFGHIIDPKTGRPSTNGVIAVTVIADDATTADALDNAFMVMGVEKTFELLKKMPEIGVYMVYRKTDGTITDTSNVLFERYISTAF